MTRRAPDPERPRRRETAGSYLLADTVPADTPMLTCRCGGLYLDYTDGKQAHLTVFGHRPMSDAETAETAEGGD